MADAHTYSAHGKAHRMLARLEAGPASTAELRDAADGAAPNRRRRRLFGLIEALADDGLIARAEAFGFVLTRPGADLLAALRAGHDVTLRTLSEAA